jgi:hypothetical protein
MIVVIISAYGRFHNNNNNNDDDVVVDVGCYIVHDVIACVLLMAEVYNVLLMLS